MLMTIPLIIEVGLVSRISALGSFDYSLFSKLLISLDFGLQGVESNTVTKISDHLRNTLLQSYNVSIFIIYNKRQSIVHEVYIIIPSPSLKTTEGNNLLNCLAKIIKSLKSSGLIAKPSIIKSKISLDYCTILGIQDLKNFSKQLAQCLKESWS